MTPPTTVPAVPPPADRLAAPLVRETLRRRRVPLGRLRETLTVAADADLRRAAVPRADRLRTLAHLRRFLRAFADRTGLPGSRDVERHLGELRAGCGLPAAFVERRSRAVRLLYRLARPAARG